MDIKTIKRIRRHKRIRAKISGTALQPRLSVFRSNKAVYGQLIDDSAGKTLAAASTAEMKEGKSALDKARAAGRALAERARKNKVERAVFDRGGFIYTGKIKAFAEGAREGGLTF